MTTHDGWDVNRCTTCAQARVELIERETILATVAARTFEGTVRAERCPRCAAVTFDASEVDAFEEAVALELAKSGPINGETLRYLRTAGLGVRIDDLARWLDLEPETLSQWERGTGLVPLMLWATVAVMVVSWTWELHSTRERPRILVGPRPFAKAVSIARHSR